MKNFKINLLFIYFNFSIFLNYNIEAQNPAPHSSVNLDSVNICPKSDYKLIWFDEFNGTSLNINTWDTTCVNSSRDPLVSDLASNILVSDGICTLKYKANMDPSQNGVIKPSASAITTKFGVPKFARIEARIFYPKSINSKSSAFWTWNNIEYDIFEMYNNDIFYSVHRWFTSPHYDGLSSSTFNAELYTGKWVLWAIEIDPNEVRWYADNTLIHCIKKYLPISNSPPNGQDFFNCDNICEFNGDYYSNYYLANTDEVFWQSIIFNTGRVPNGFPVSHSMLIDYVRVYQREPQNDKDYYDICGLKTSNNFVCDSNEIITLCKNENNKFNIITPPEFQITQSPAYNLVPIDTLTNVLNQDSIVYDTIVMTNCLRGKFNSNYTTTNSKFYIDVEGCKSKKENINWGFNFIKSEPKLEISFSNLCQGYVKITNTTKYNDTFVVRNWRILNETSLSSLPTIRQLSSDNIFVNIKRESILKGKYFYLELEVSSACGTKKIIKKIFIPKNCTELLLRPNPSIDNLIIELETGIKKIEIRDNFGVLQFQKDYANSSQYINESINVSNFPNGIYKIMVLDSDDETYQKEFIVSK